METVLTWEVFGWLYLFAVVNLSNWRVEKQVYDDVLGVVASGEYFPMTFSSIPIPEFCLPGDLSEVCCQTP